jgi:hypothetical protein
MGRRAEVAVPNKSMVSLNLCEKVAEISDCNWAKIDNGKVNCFNEHSSIEGKGGAGQPQGSPAY